MSKAYLCIGGPKDGELIATNGEIYQYAVETEGTADPDPTHVVYRLSKFAGETEVFQVYALNHMTGDDILRQMISNYRPKVGA